MRDGVGLPAEPQDSSDDEQFFRLFDILLDQSSLGSPRAIAIQALTPPAVAAALEAATETSLAARRPQPTTEPPT